MLTYEEKLGILEVLIKALEEETTSQKAKGNDVFGLNTYTCGLKIAYDIMKPKQ